VPEIIKQLKAQTEQNFTLNIWNNSDHKLEIDFPKDRLRVIESKKNVGSLARFRLAKQTKGSPIIFIDDDQYLEKDFIDSCLDEFDLYGEKTILGFFTRIFLDENYWRNPPGDVGEEVDYVGTAGMVLDREIIDEEPLLQNIPKLYQKIEDLYLCHLARMKYGMKLRRIEARTHIIKDGLDQCDTIPKKSLYQHLRGEGWELLRDARN